MPSRIINHIETRTIEAAPLAVFRILFGFLLAAETGGAILTGWVRRAHVEPDFTFTFIGFEWLRMFNGPLMYGWFALMALLGIAVMLGWRYRWSLGAFTLLWTGSYLMQKAHYNNHYYLLILLCLLMILAPAHAMASLDARRDPRIRARRVPAWTRDMIILLLAVVYTFAALAKVQADWLTGHNVEVWFQAKKHYPIIGPGLQEPWIHGLVAWGGFLFDLLIVPALLWKRTRWLAVGASFVFHIFNSVVFQVGIFPYLMLGALVLFFPSELIARRFFPKHKPEPLLSHSPSFRRWLAPLVVFFLLQMVLPLRHHLIPGDVNWTEEGHRMSWRMMLRYKHGRGKVWLKVPGEEKRELIPYREHLTASQAGKLFSYPDFAWQYAQWLKKQRQQEGIFPEIYFESEVSLNGHAFQPLIDPEVDLAAAKWDYFGRNGWVLEMKE
ncbi:MAG: HTTM domain-containing protein [Bacteroidia bacterium]